MDDILRSNKKDLVDSKLVDINQLHPNLRFTIEREQHGQLPFLDTGLIMNFHAVAPRKYKRSVVQGGVRALHLPCL